MSVPSVFKSITLERPFRVVPFLALLICLAISIAPAHADMFSAPPSDAAASPFDQALVYVQQMQSQAYRALAKAATGLQDQMTGAAAATLVGLSFFYGILHALGPGHGKAVVTSYLLAGERKLRRGIGLAFLSAAMQAVTAIVLVGALAMIAGLSTRATMNTVPYVEKASFAMVAMLGLWMIWRALRGGFGHAHGHSGHDDFEYEEHAYDERHDHHGHGHSHTLAPDQLDRTTSRRESIALVLSVGLRPCSGAILVLLFTAALGAFWIGVVGTLAMALGTAITVSGLGFLTVASRALALRIVGPRGSARIAHIERVLGVLGGLLVFAIGVILFVTSVNSPAGPFGLS